MNSFLDELDEIDKKIIELLQKNPCITHDEIGNIINKSQPTVGARIIKLLRKGVLGNIYGVNLKTSNIPLMLVDIETNDNNDINSRVECCPFVLNVFNKTGTSNYLMIATASNIDKLNEIVDACLRRDKTIKSVSTSYVVKIKNDLIVPLNFNIEFYEKINCANDCPFKEKKQVIVSKSNTHPVKEKVAEFHEMKVYFDNMLDSILKFTSADSIGIRLLSTSGLLDFYSWKGITDDQFKKENTIALGDCLCGRVCRGDTSDGLLSKSGSFVTNNISSIQEKGADIIEKDMQGSCFNQEYESVAIIPLRTGNKNIGVLFIATYRKNAFPSEVVNALESFSNLIANAVLTAIADSGKVESIEPKTEV